jgi:hypothetical protein
MDMLDSGVRTGDWQSILLPVQVHDIVQLELRPNGSFIIDDTIYHQNYEDIDLLITGDWNFNKRQGKGQPLIALNSSLVKKLSFEFVNGCWHQRAFVRHLHTSSPWGCVLLLPEHVHVCNPPMRIPLSSELQWSVVDQKRAFHVTVGTVGRRTVSIQPKGEACRHFLNKDGAWYDLLFEFYPIDPDGVPTTLIPPFPYEHFEEYAIFPDHVWVGKADSRFHNTISTQRDRCTVRECRGLVLCDDGRIEVGNEEFAAAEEFERDYLSIVVSRVGDDFEIRSYSTHSGTSDFDAPSFWHRPQRHKGWTVTRFRYGPKGWQRHVPYSRDIDRWNMWRSSGTELSFCATALFVFTASVPAWRILFDFVPVLEHLIEGAP